MKIGILWENFEIGGVTTHLENLLNNKAFKDFKFVVITNKTNKASKILKIKPVQNIDFTLAHTDDHILLFKRNLETFWEGLWLPSEDPKNQKIYKSESINNENIKVKHKLTHLDLNLSIDLLRYNNIFEVVTNAEYCWIDKSQIDSYGMPAPIKKIISTL